MKQLKVEIPEGIKEEDMQQAVKQTIFRPAPPDTKVQGWLRNKANKYVQKSDQGRKRFVRVHMIVKAKLAYPLLKCVDKYLDKYLVRSLDEIPAQAHNNILRMFFWASNKGLEDMWKKFYWTMNPGGKKIQGDTPDGFYERTKKNNKSHKYRETIINILLTEAAEDTVDREWLNFSCLRFTHAMMNHYGVSKEEADKVPKSGDYPIYLSTNQQNPDFFLKFIGSKVWKPETGKTPEQERQVLLKELKELKAWKTAKELEESKTIAMQNLGPGSFSGEMAKTLKMQQDGVQGMTNLFNAGLNNELGKVIKNEKDNKEKD